MTRTQSSIKNLITAMIGQAAGLLISFAARIVFLHCLNEEYLGVSGLFTNILTVLSLVELGVGPAMVYSLYKPIAENDTEQIKSLMLLYKKAYRIIGCAVLAVGLAFTPLYTVFMDEAPDIPRLTEVYLLFVANTGISYFYSYKRSLIICDQKRYIATIYRYSFYFALNLAQIIALLLTSDYILFLILQVCATWLENVCVSIRADKMYPYLKDKNVNLPDRKTLAGIKKNVSAMLMHKIGGIVVQSTDNIVLSKFVGLAAVGLYSNYQLVTNALTTIILQFFNSIIASVGNLTAEGDISGNIGKLAETFYKTFFANFIIYGYCAVCMTSLFTPFITVFFGENMLLDGLTTAAIVITFYLTGMRRSILTFREAAGAFSYDRWKPLFESAVNIIASVLLAKKIGSAGVFIGTVISTLTTCFWIEPLVVFRHVLKCSSKKYWLRYAAYTSVTAVCCALAYFICSFIGMSLTGIILRLIICTAVFGCAAAIIYGRSSEFIYCRSMAASIITRAAAKLKK